MTAKEYDIFCLLVANKNRVLTYDQIYEKVWGDFSSGGERETIGFSMIKEISPSSRKFHYTHTRENGIEAPFLLWNCFW